MPKRAPPQPTTAEGLPPLSDGGHWWGKIRDEALHEYQPGALLQLYDARGPEDDSRMATIILSHVLGAALAIIRRRVSWNARERDDLIDDVFGEVGEAIADPLEMPLRRYFGSFVRNLCLEASRRQWRKQAKRQDDGIEDIAAHPDAEMAALSDIDLSDLLARISQKEHREAIGMLLDGSCYKEVAAAMGRHRTTVVDWVRKSDPELIEHLRSRPR